MKANELRIGNWVSYLGNPIQMNLGWFTHDLQPIPLTPEIMVMAGFGKGGEGFYYKNGIEYNLDEQLLEGIGDVPLQYVHQLQNLYFALTGQELTIDLNH